MKQKISLGSSISVLIGAVIAILALLRGPVQTVLLLVTFILWGLWVLLTLLRPAWRDNRAYRRQEVLEAERRDYLSNRNVAQLLLCHVNYRVSDHLKKAYPALAPDGGAAAVRGAAPRPGPRVPGQKRLCRRGLL